MVNCDRTWTSTSNAAIGRSAGSKSSASHDSPGPESGEHDGPSDDAHRRPLQVRASTGHGRSVERHDSGSADGSMKLDGKKIKRGQRQMITQAWEKHRKDQIAVSADRFEINEVWHAEWDAEMKRSMNETFVTTLQLPSPFVTEVYTDTEPVAKAARQLGLHAGDSLTLKSGWDFRREDHRRAALRLVKKLKPYCTVLAFPCGPWSPLMQLNPAADRERLRSEGEILINFAIEIAEEQMKHGRHFVMENPRPSAAWRLPQLEVFAHRDGILPVDIDMCHFGLKGPGGGLHKKSTRLLTSSQAMVSRLIACRCTGDHLHEHVIGGSRISQAAGHSFFP